MAKKQTNGFRKIDIDQYNDDLFKEEESVDVQSPVTGVDEQEVNRLLQSGKHVEAIKYLISVCPLNSKNQAAKDCALNLMMQAMSAVKTSEMDKVIDALDIDQIDIIMKYIYRGFENPSDNRSGHLLIWHEKAYTKAGLGSIVRVLTDKKRV
ncbi:Actin-related protein 2/3 complex subunit 5-like protein [Dinothrombium tinctorium]|uniref:Actin-related protein 2/3 complex subunit 5 n=1 Tax=Dinothrombium tinctorium TaxID=1965070 RepID=A0A3S4RHU7_9ACAR|nr:Actin-related protein 2/3 complex subunit 5-like protein [Dinothrombium tinctorium]